MLAMPHLGDEGHDVGGSAARAGAQQGDTRRQRHRQAAKPARGQGPMPRAGKHSRRRVLLLPRCVCCARPQRRASRAQRRAHLLKSHPSSGMHVYCSTRPSSSSPGIRWNTPVKSSTCAAVAGGQSGAACVPTRVCRPQVRQRPAASPTFMVSPMPSIVAARPHVIHLVLIHVKAGGNVKAVTAASTIQTGNRFVAAWLSSAALSHPDVGAAAPGAPSLAAALVHTHCPQAGTARRWHGAVACCANVNRR